MLFRHLTDQQSDTRLDQTSHLWIRGPELPEDVVADDLLTAEDHRDLTLDHIARTCKVIVHFQIIKKA